jgi:hypothetical protein
MRLPQIIRQVLLRVSLLLQLISFIKTERFFLLFCEGNRILFDFESSHIIGLLDRLISRN